MRITAQSLNLENLSDDPQVYDALTADDFTEALAPMIDSYTLTVEQGARAVLALTQYARNRAAALRARAEGHPRKADAAEKVCEAIRRTLPDPIRW